MRVVGYIRVSTEEQATGGVSLAAQRARIEAYAQLYEIELVEIVEEGFASGKSLDRPALKRALKMLRSGKVDGIAVAKLDRLTRNVSDMAKLVTEYFSESAGKSLLSVSDQVDTRTAAGRLVLHVLVSVAQWERETIAERTVDALRHKKANGARLGAVPLGFRRDGDHFVEDPEEQRVVARARELAASGANQSAIARTLTAEGHRSKRGGTWHATTVRKLLARVS